MDLSVLLQKVSTKSGQAHTYRLRCMKGSTASAYSDEMSMNPVR